jgi:glucose-6-phosphate 1-dehydrogenase
MSTEDVLKHVVRGQYKDYRKELKVDPESHTETFAAMRLYVENWRWQGVPFYLRSGKALADKTSEIIIQFKCPPMNMFKLPADYEISSNVLGICLQPNEGIHLRFEAKVPDTLSDLRNVDMDFHYRESFGETKIPEAYERLLLDAIQGDASLFTRADQTEESWKIIDPIIAGLHSAGAPQLLEYEPGSWGPKEADEFMARDGRTWYHFC